MGTQTTANGPYRPLIEWLERNDIPHEVHEHPVAFTAAATATAERVDPRVFAKVVGVSTDDGRRALLVVDAPDRVDLRKARVALHARDVRLVDEAELTALAPGCEPGALPAVGALFDTPMLADFAVRDDPTIVFNAGDHGHAVHVDRAAWERSAGVSYSDLAEDEPGVPAWARS
jgi:Ala-tRNA(Pro) deacylase